ncbi:MAG: lysophospholipid acyltransferase family protein [Gemmataceae bacterium]
MKLRKPWLIRLVGFLAHWLIRLWMSTLRYRIHALDAEHHPADARRKRYIYAIWHENMLFPAVFQAKVHILISQHADGELIAQVCRHFRVGLVRGSTTRGGTKALLELLRASRRSHLIVTPDGPRGPRRRVQLGLIFVASQTGLPIIACGVGYANAWRARSWDRFGLPLPFSTVTAVGSRAIHVPPNLDRKEMEQYRQLVEDEFLRVTAAAERWASGVKPSVARTASPAPAARKSA